MSSVIIILCFFSILFITFVLFTSIGVGGFLFFYEHDEDTTACTNDPCGDNATCTVIDTGFSCNCDNGYTGTSTTNNQPNCTSNTVDACTGDPCGDNAICTVIDTGFSCNCDNGYTGTSTTNNQPNCTSNTVDTWILQTTAGQTCDTTCENSGRICTDGNWGVDSEATMNAALAAASVSGATRCDSYNQGTVNWVPAVQPSSPGGCYYLHPSFTPTCSATTHTHLRLCKCE